MKRPKIVAALLAVGAVALIFGLIGSAYWA